MRAEYIVAHGNSEVMLCERGIRTFETVTRNTCGIAAIPALNELTHLPVILDPSHATGKRSLVPAVSRAGRSEEHTSELQSRRDLVCRLLLEKKKNINPQGKHLYAHDEIKV